MTLSAEMFDPVDDDERRWLLRLENRAIFDLRSVSPHAAVCRSLLHPKGKKGQRPAHDRSRRRRRFTSTTVRPAAVAPTS
jgi:hypothetical protein